MPNPMTVRLNQINFDHAGQGIDFDAQGNGEDVELPPYAMYMKASVTLPAGIPQGPYLCNDAMAINHSSTSMSGPRIELIVSGTRSSHNFGAIRRHKDCLRTIGYFSRESFQVLMDELYATPSLRRTTVGQRWPRKIQVRFIGVVDQGRYNSIDNHSIPSKTRTAHVMLYWRPPGY